MGNLLVNFGDLLLAENLPLKGQKFVFVCNVPEHISEGRNWQELPRDYEKCRELPVCEGADLIIKIKKNKIKVIDPALRRYTNFQGGSYTSAVQTLMSEAAA
jgi:hypothetical protein